jgi:hypothetical protein
MMEFCSSVDFKAKLTDVARTIARKEPSFNMTMPSRISFIGTNSWVVFDAVAIFDNLVFFFIFQRVASLT